LPDDTSPTKTRSGGCTRMISAGRFHRTLAISLIALSSVVASAAVARLHRASAAESFDTVIANARAIDPESALDAGRKVGIRNGKIAAVSPKPLTGKSTIDAKGLVVAPGFIDPHEHGQDPRNYGFQARDGVTTSLELEGGTDYVDKWYAEREGKSLIN